MAKATPGPPPDDEDTPPVTSHTPTATTHFGTESGPTVGKVEPDIGMELVDLCAGAECEQVCVGVSETAVECSCREGYTLGDNMKSCRGKIAVCTY